MRSLACLGLVLALALASGCDSDQPLEISDRNASLRFVASNATVKRFDVWEMWEDSDGVPGPDDVNDDGVEDTWRWCQLPGPVDQQTGIATSVPWTYSLRVSVLPAGEANFVPVTSSSALQDGNNRAGYDTSVLANFTSLPAQIIASHPRGRCANANLLCNPDSTSSFCANNGAGGCFAQYACSGDPDTLCGFANPEFPDPCPDLGLGTCVNPTVSRNFFFDLTTKTRLSAANILFSQPTGNGLRDACILGASGNACTGVPTSIASNLPGLCPSHSLGAEQIDDQPLTTLDLTLEKGDTLMVEARRFGTIPGGITFVTTPQIVSSLVVDGLQLQPEEYCPADNPQCNSTSNDSISAIKFFYVAN
jgi:hypothetical protein